MIGAVVLVATAYAQVPRTEVFTRPPKETSQAWRATEWVDPDIYGKIWSNHRALKESSAKVKAELDRRMKELPDNSREAYELGYYAYVDSHLSAKSIRYPTPQMIAAHMMAKYPANSSAEFTRLRFLLQARSWPGLNLTGVGRRLVARFARQPGLRMHLAVGLVFLDDPARQDEGISILQALVTEYPGDPDYLGSLADAYAMVGIRRRDMPLKQRAKAMYERFLKLPGLSNESRTMASMRLKAVDRSMTP